MRLGMNPYTVDGDTARMELIDRSGAVDGICGAPKNILLHRLLMMPNPGLIVDHINGDTMDNRRDNLRIVTQQANLRNRLVSTNKWGHMGISRTHTGLFVAMCCGKRIASDHALENVVAAAREYRRANGIHVAYDMALENFLSQLIDSANSPETAKE